MVFLKFDGLTQHWRITGSFELVITARVQDPTYFKPIINTYQPISKPSKSEKSRRERSEALQSQWKRYEAAPEILSEAKRCGARLRDAAEAKHEEARLAKPNKAEEIAVDKANCGEVRKAR